MNDVRTSVSQCYSCCMSSFIKGSACLLFSALMFGAWGILSRYLGQSFDLFFQFWTRYLFVALVLCFVLVFQRSWKTVQNEHKHLFVIRVVSALLTSLCIYLAFNAIPIGTAYFASYAGTILGGFLIGSFFFNEKINALKIAAVALSVVGLYIIYSFSFATSQIFYLFLALSSGVSYSIFYSCSKTISKRYSIIQMTFIDYAGCFILTLILSFLLHEHWSPVALTFSWLINLIAAVTFALTNMLLIYGFKRVGVQVGTTILLTEVVFGILFAYFFFDEAISTNMLIGGGMILLASGLVVVSPHRLEFRSAKR